MVAILEAPYSRPICKSLSRRRDLRKLVAKAPDVRVRFWIVRHSNLGAPNSPQYLALHIAVFI